MHVWVCVSMRLHVQGHQGMLFPSLHSLFLEQIQAAIAVHLQDCKDVAFFNHQKSRGVGEMKRIQK